MLTVYTTDTCSYCKIVKKYLTSKNVEFQEVDVTSDGSLREKLLKMTGLSTVPVTTNGDDFVVGFQPKLLSELIA